MKVLDVDLFQDGIHRNITMLDRLGKEMETIHKSVDGLVAMEEMLKGEGGNAIRAFYAECHIPFLQFFQLFQNGFTSILKQIESALDALEPDPAGYILQQFLEIEVEQGLQQIAELTESLTNETNSIINQVADIVGLPHLDDSEVQLGVRDAKIKRDDTVTRLHEFDATQTKALWTIEDNLHTMESWITDIEGLFKEELTDIHFQADRWAILSSENKLKVDLALQKATLGALTGMEGLDIQPETMLRAFLANINPTMFGLNGLIQKPHAFWGPSILAFSSIPYKPVSENQLNKPAMTEEEQLEALYVELAKHPNIANPSNDAPIDPATGDYMITYEGMRKVLGGNGPGTPDGLAPYAVAAFNFYTEDIATMFGPDSTMDERMLAAAFTFIKPAKIADAGHDLVKAGEKAKDVGKGSVNTVEDKVKVNSNNIRAYRDIDIEEIPIEYRADPRLVSEMNYKGKQKSGTNASGWERSASKHYNDLLDKHPEFFSDANVERIENGLVPIVDDDFIKHFPQYKDFNGDKLIHHHIGGGGQAAAVPQSLHKGFGGIHNFEKEHNIRGNDPLTEIGEVFTSEKKP